uniref:Uncharacterized protein n=1 Tax=Rhipicephalus microplus TaxID=6941 RepID=A0A6G5AHS0_RHIMP
MQCIRAYGCLYCNVCCFIYQALFLRLKILRVQGLKKPNAECCLYKYVLMSNSRKFSKNLQIFLFHLQFVRVCCVTHAYIVHLVSAVVQLMTKNTFFYIEYL